MEQQRLRIFISSPADVGEERRIAGQVVERLGLEYAYHFRVEPVFWEREPLMATEHFQTMILPPAQTDIVVVVLWSRLGSLLPIAEFPGPLSGKQVTGTEWEFENAVKSYRECKKPELIFYRKSAPITGSFDNEEVVNQVIHQKKLVEEFVRQWFVDEEAKSFKAAFRTFMTPAEFEEMLEQHLRGLLRGRLPWSGGDDLATGGISWPWEPFRGLRSFELQHAAIYCGRTRARHELREVLKRRVAAGCALVLVLGASGSGKSSLIKAGLLSDLLVPGMMERVAVCRNVVVTPALLGSDPVRGLADALLREQAQPTTPGDLQTCGQAEVLRRDRALPEMGHNGLDWDGASLAGQLRGEAVQAMKPIRQGLSAAGRAEQLTAHAESRLLVVVDQFEELFTSGDLSQEARQEFVGVLGKLARSGVAWVVGAMRSDFIHHLEAMPDLMDLTPGEARLHLKPCDPHELGEIVLRPARMAGLRFEKDGEKGVSLNDVIVQEAAKDPGVLPMLQFLLESLWQERTAEGLLTFAAFERLGGLGGALGRMAEEVFAGLGREEQQAFASAMRLLVTVGGGGDGGRPTARTAALAQFGEGTPLRRLVEAFSSDRARLVVWDDPGTGASVRLVHEALLSHRPKTNGQTRAEPYWPRAAKQIELDYRDLQVRGRLEMAAARWLAADRLEQSDLLLPSGLLLQEGRGLLSRWSSGELEPGIVAYVEASIALHRWRRWKQTMSAGLLSLLALPGGYGVYWGARTYLGVQEVEKEMALVSIPKGCYWMGSPETEMDRGQDEKQHEVCVAGFELGKFEVTQWEWERVMHDNPSSFKGAKKPVEMVSWVEAMGFIRYMNWFGHYRYRLPSEAEWEYAARGGTTTSRYWGDGEKEACHYANVMDLDARARFGKQIGSWFDCRDQAELTVSAGTYQPNAFGLHDMLGNVWEWTCLSAEGSNGSGEGCAKAGDTGSSQVSRGGSWNDHPALVRAAFRGKPVPGYRGHDLGLRLLRMPP